MPQHGNPGSSVGTPVGQFSYGGPGNPARDHFLVSPESRQKRPITGDVDQPGNTTRVPGDMATSGRTELDRRMFGCNVNAMIDVLAHFREGQWRKMTAQRDSLAQLA
jgi:hypothetical protein